MRPDHDACSAPRQTTARIAADRWGVQVVRVAAVGRPDQDDLRSAGLAGVKVTC